MPGSEVAILCLRVKTPKDEERHTGGGSAHRERESRRPARPVAVARRLPVKVVNLLKVLSAAFPDSVPENNSNTCACWRGSRHFPSPVNTAHRSMDLTWSWKRHSMINTWNVSSVTRNIQGKGIESDRTYPKKGSLRRWQLPWLKCEINPCFGEKSLHTEATECTKATREEHARHIHDLQITPRTEAQCTR